MTALTLIFMDFPLIITGKQMRPFPTLKFWLFQIDTSFFRIGTFTTLGSARDFAFVRAFLLLALMDTSFLYFFKTLEESLIAWFFKALGKLAETSLLCLLY